MLVEWWNYHLSQAQGLCAASLQPCTYLKLSVLGWYCKNYNHSLCRLVHCTKTHFMS